MDFFMENKSQVLDNLSRSKNNSTNFPPSAVTDLLAAVVLNDAEKSNKMDGCTGFKHMRVGALIQKLQEDGLDVDGSRQMMIARLEEDMSKKKAKVSYD